VEQTPRPWTAQQRDEFGLLDVALILWKNKILTLGLPLISGLVAFIVASLIPPIYTATTRLLPPQQRESSAATMLSALTSGAGPATATVGQALGIRNPNELYAGVLKGHSIADRLIERFNLKGLYEAATTMSARNALASATKISVGKDSLITIEVDDRDASRAADIANAYVVELDRLMQRLAVSEAARRRLFFERQLATAREELAAAETVLRHAIETKGIAGLDSQTRAVVGTAEQLRAQIAIKEIQLHAMRTFSTDHNPEAVRRRQEIASMRAELAKLEGGGRSDNGLAAPAGAENVRKLREVKFLEFNVELLTKQYEVAKIDEARDAVLIQVVDHATPPDHKSKPRRGLIVLLTIAVVSCVAAFIAFAKEAMMRRSVRPDTAG
jgi:uncharacterized protein involved in exopolysaccharide biosynthesis